MNTQIFDCPFTDKADRSELAPLEGQIVRFEGRVFNISSPSRTKKYSCLRNVKIATVDNTTSFADAEHIHIHHLWFDVSQCDHMKHQLYQEITGSGLVTKYQRKDGSYSYNIALGSSGEFVGEQGLKTWLVDAVEAVLSTPGLTFNERIECVDVIEKQLDDALKKNPVILHDETLDSLHQKLDRSLLMRSVGVYTTNNREGRRRYRKVRHRTNTPVARGFA